MCPACYPVFLTTAIQIKSFLYHSYTMHTNNLTTTKVSVNLERSELPRVVLSTMFVSPIPSEGHFSSSRNPSLSCTSPDSYKHGPEVNIVKFKVINTYIVGLIKERDLR